MKKKLKIFEYKHLALTPRKDATSHGSVVYGFTLAETLITLLVIGVVAALTIPALNQQISEYTLNKQKTVFEKKFAEGLRQMRVDEKLAEKYATTEDFINEMKKYFKISTVCNKEDLDNCFTSSFSANAILNGKETASKTFITSNIKTAKNIVENSSYDSDVMGIIFSDGVKMLLTNDPDCAGVESGDTQGDLYSCFGFIADVNGAKSPNANGKDIVSNLPLIKNFGLNFEIIDNKVYKANACDSENICFRPVKGPSYNSDYWLGAQEFCAKKGGHLPSASELEEIADRLFSEAKSSCNVTATQDATPDKNGDNGFNYYKDCVDTEKVKQSPLYSLLIVSANGTNYFWGDTSYNNGSAYGRDFDPNGTFSRYFFWDGNRSWSAYSVFCIK
ncbi:MAG: type II secretion system GspH family protein [bacterium]|nr:type II secretion system GspH family protein [bacterium]